MRDEGGISKKIVQRLLTINLWHLVWIPVAFFEIFTLVMNSINGLIVYGRIDYNLIMMGIIDAFFAALVISVLIVLFVLELRKSEKVRMGELDKLNQELKYSNHLTGLFTDILRHDLLNPTGVIMNLADIIKEDENLKDSAELAVIKRNAVKLEGMINNASVFGKIESSREVEKERLELGEIVTTAIKNLEMYAPEKEAKIEFNKQGRHELRASPMMVSAVENLITNAIKYGPVGHDIKIAISDEGDNLMVSVKDQGEGVPDKFKEAIFDRFTRKDKIGVKGSGLELAIVKRIVELHGGRVWVEDNPGGQGSVFIVSLPKDNKIKEKERSQ
jgi:signal transduction histidine kinase